MLELNHVEPGTYAHTVVRDVTKEYADLVLYMDGAVVLDVGAHVGAFTIMALNAGAKKVICIEPGSPSIALLKKNVAPAADRVLIKHAAVTGENRVFKTELRYLSHNRSMAGAKTWFKRHSPSWRGIPYVYETIDTIYFPYLVKHFKTNVIKLDCEGPEYECIECMDKMPQHVKAIAVEWHKTQGKTILRYQSCTRKLQRWGFKPLKKPNLVLRYDETGKVIGSNQFFIRPITWVRTS